MIRVLKARLRLLWRRGDEGIAMVMVIGVGSVLTLLVVAAVATSLGGLEKSAKDANWNSALAAAYAGIEEYQSRLANEPAYVKYGNPAAEFSMPDPGDPVTVELPGPSESNPAFGIGPSGTWADVPQSDGHAQYRYEVDNSDYATSGTIHLRSTGRTGSETRTIVADLRQTGFIDFLYFTDYEIIDPEQSSSSCVPKHAWEVASRPSCTVIQFADGDRIGGPLHSNDTMRLCGTVFEGVVTTGKPGGGYTNPGTSPCGTPTFEKGAPIYSPSISMPATNTQLKKETRSDLTGSDVPRPGCLYTGPTKIEFLSGGKMKVISPWTKFTNIVGDPVTGGNNANSAQCGTITALNTSGATIDVPENNVVYVQNIPLSGINSATLAQTTSSGTNKRCRDLAGNTMSNNEGYSRNIVGYPIADEIPPNPGTEPGDSYGCRNGDLFIKGELSGGAVTIAAENYIYVTGDITYANSDNDMLGLIGQNAVWVYNPMDDDADAMLANNRRIDAAILSVDHTFMVQSYNRDMGSGRGTLTVNGAIAQKFRGTVGTSSGYSRTGYTKNYRYDSRFRYTAPPKFLSPVTTTYGVNIWVEVSPAFNADGTYR